MSSNRFSLNPVIAATGGAPTGGEPPPGSGGVPWDLISLRNRRGGRGMGGLDPFQQMMLNALQRRAMFITTPFNYTTTVALLRPQEERGYFFIQNNSLAASLYVGFGQQPTPSTGVVVPAGGYYEPFQVPQNEIWIIGSATDVGILITAPLFQLGMQAPGMGPSE